VRFSVEVLVTLKPGLADPQGKAVEGALPTLGWTNVAARLLSNPVIEDSRILEVREAQHT
jgi:phosphoribosylformylglycinamidine (FGAM) synthase PurS component